MYRSLRYEPTGYDVWVLNADGSGERRVVRQPGPDITPIWSPDGSRILFAGSDGLQIVNADGGGAFRIGDGDHPTWRR